MLTQYTVQLSLIWFHAVILWESFLVCDLIFAKLPIFTDQALDIDDGDIILVKKQTQAKKYMEGDTDNISYLVEAYILVSYQRKSRILGRQ